MTVLPRKPIPRVVRGAIFTVLLSVVIAYPHVSVAADPRPLSFHTTVIEELTGGVTPGAPVLQAPQAPKAEWEETAGKGEGESQSSKAPAPQASDSQNEQTDVKPAAEPTDEAPASAKPADETSVEESKPQAEAEPAQADKEKDFAALMKEAADLAEGDKHAAALAKYEAAFVRARRDEDRKRIAAALDGLGRMSIRLGREDRALVYLRDAIKLYHALKNARLRSLDYILVGRILMDRGEYAKALRNFEEASRLLPASEAAERPRLLEDTAICLLRLYEYPQALSTLQRLLALVRKTGNEKETARIYVMIGETEVSRSDYQSARRRFKNSEEIYRRTNMTRELADTLCRIAYIDQMEGSLKSAQRLMDEVRKLLAGRSDEDGAFALPLLVRGMQARAEGRMILAAKSLNAALARYRKSRDPVMAARARLELASLEHDRALSRSALRHAGKALSEFRALSDRGGEAKALKVVAEVYLSQGYIRKSLEYAQESLATARKIGDKEAIAQACIVLARIHNILGDVSFSAKLLKEAYEQLSPRVNRRTQGEIRLAVAEFRLERDALDKALQALVAARKEFGEIGDRRGLADCDNLEARICERKGNKEKAKELAERALSEHRAMWDRRGEARDLTVLGVHYKNRGDRDKAMNVFQSALELCEGIEYRRGYAANSANIGNLYKHAGETPEAIKRLKHALKTYKELSHKKGEADTLANLGAVHTATGAYAVAAENLKRALELHREIGDSRGAAVDLAGLGRLYLLTGDLANARTHLDEALKSDEGVVNPRGKVALLAELAMLERAERNTSRAYSLLKQALALAEKSNDERAISSLYLKTARVLEDAGKNRRALKLLEKALEMMRNQGDRTGELWALSALGTVQVKMEDFESALTHLHEAAALRSELGIPAAQTQDIDFYLGEIYEGFKDFEQALEHYHQALATAQISGTDTMRGKIYDRIGSIYLRIEDYAKAKEFLEDALRVHSENHDVEMQKKELIRLGDIMSKLGNNEEALKHQIKALSLTRESGDDRTEARILTRIGTLHQMLGRPRAALQYYDEALEKRRSLGDRRGVNENLLQIALVQSILGKFEQAKTSLKDALRIAECSEDRSMLWKAYFIIGRTYQGKRKPKEALEAYRRAIRIIEAMEADAVEESEEDNFIFGGRKALFETTLNVLMRLAKEDPKGAYDNQALRIVEKLKAANFEENLARINVESFSDLPNDLLIKEKSLRLGLKRVSARLSREMSAVHPDQKRIRRLLEERRAKEKAFAQLKETLEKDYPAYAALRYPKPVTVHQLQKEVLAPDEALLEYMVTRGKTYLFAIDKHRFHTYSIDYSLNEIQEDVRTLIRPLYRGDTHANWDPSVAYRLYSRIIKPVESFIAKKKVVMVAPHGPLRSLPFEMLVSSESHAARRFWSPSDKPDYLLERYAFCYTPSAASLHYLRSRTRNVKPGWNLAAFGDALYGHEETKLNLNKGAERLLASLQTDGEESRGPSLRPLPGARREITEIVKIVGEPAQTYFGAEATESLFKKADLTRYGYIHLATHGTLLRGAGKLRRQPAIVFSLYGDRENDGFLQLGEVFGLKLNADLVVLSSCLSQGEAAPFSADGLNGLARAFLFAGADSVILSMWEVNDAGAAQLFIEMYRRLKNSSKAEALRQAKLSLLRNPSTSHPYYWAPFILMGRWDITYPPSFNAVDPKKVRFKGLSGWRRFLSL